MKRALLPLGLAIAAPLSAADLDVVVHQPNGAPVADAVVTVHLVGQSTPRPRPNGSYAIDQANIQFHPFVSAVPVGASVAFMNHDAVRHHVYSFSTARKFELKLEKQEQNRTVLFDKPGIVPIGCNIHDRMIAFIVVTDTPWTAITDAKGHVMLRGIPAGTASIEVWHPYARAPGNQVAQSFTLAATGTNRSQAVVPLRLPPRTPDAGY